MPTLIPVASSQPNPTQCLPWDSPCAPLTCRCPQEQKEQLAELEVQLGALARRAQGIVQLKPRSPDTPLQGRPSLQAVCDYKQMEVRGAPGATGGLGRGTERALGSSGGGLEATAGLQRALGSSAEH